VPLPTIADTFRVTLNWDAGGSQSFHNVLHFFNATGNETDVYNDMNAHVTTGMWGLINGGFKVTSVDVIDLGHAFTSVHFATGSPAKWSGQAGGQVIPQGAAVITERTNLRGRSHRGRIYLPAIDESVQNDGVLDAATVASSQTAWNTFLTAMGATNSQPVVASYKLSTESGITSYVVRPKLRTQRRRALK